MSIRALVAIVIVLCGTGDRPTGLQAATAAKIGGSPLNAGGAPTCVAVYPVACPSDLRAIPVRGSAFRGYLDHRLGLMIRITGAYVGRVNQDDGCGLPQYELFLQVIFHNAQSHAIMFDLVGLTVQDQARRVYNPFSWGGPNPSRATPFGAKKTRSVRLPYGFAGDILGSNPDPKPRSLAVRWADVYHNPTTRPAHVALYRVRPTGIKACP